MIYSIEFLGNIVIKVNGKICEHEAEKLDLSSRIYMVDECDMLKCRLDKSILETVIEYGIDIENYKNVM